MNFSGFCYMGLLDTDFNILYCDNPFLFHRFRDSSEKLRHYIEKSVLSCTFFCRFTVDDTRYLVRVDRMMDDNLAVRISEELPKARITDKSVLDDIDGIDKGSLSKYTMAQIMLNYLVRSDYCTVDEELEARVGELLDSYTDCADILKIFEKKKSAGFIQLRKWLIHTCDVIRLASGPMMKRVSFMIDLASPYAKLEYSLLELSVYSLAKLSFMCTCTGSLSLIDIYSSKDMLNVKVNIPFQQNCHLDNFSVEMRAVKHLFKHMGGHFNFYERDGSLCGAGNISVKYSDNYEELDPNILIAINGDLSEIIERRKAGKYRRIYFLTEKDIFRSEYTEPEDVVDIEFYFARSFFGDTGGEEDNKR